MEQPRYIPCPVCGGTMAVQDWRYLEGEGSGFFIDCEQRCRSLTPPNIYEALRIQALTRMTEQELRRLRGGD